MVRFRHYVLASTLLTVAAVAWAVHTRKYFYSTAIYLTTNKVGVNVCFLLLCLLGLMLKRVFLVTLTRDEIEELVQQSKYAITETMLALTIFREELNLRMLLLFTALLFIKIFHWLAAMRVESLARSEHMTRWQHVRLLSLFALMALVDWAFVCAIGLSLLRSKTASVLLLFGFEYLILSVGLAAAFAKYVLLVLDARWEARGQHWNNKNTWMFYLELSSDLVRLCLYLVFFLIICNFYGMPLHLIRELGLTFYTLRERVLKFILYRRLTRNMQQRFPDATQAEIDAGDRTCIVCREDMEVGATKKLPCGHMFHFACLRTWLERAQSCPTCRHQIPVNEVPAAAAPAGAPAPAGAAAVAGAPGGVGAAPANAGAAPGAGGAAAAAGAAGGANGAVGAARGLAALPPDVQAHLEALGIRFPVAVDVGAPQRAASPLHPLFGTTPLPPPGSAAPLTSPLHPLFGSTPLAPQNSPAQFHGQQQQQLQQHPLLQFPSPHSLHPPMGMMTGAPLPFAAGGAGPFVRGLSGQPALALPPLIFPPPPVPPPPAHMFPVGSTAGSAAAASSGNVGTLHSPHSPFVAGSSAFHPPSHPSSLPPSLALQAAWSSHQAMLLQHHADFLRSSLAQVQILLEQQRDAERNFKAQMEAAAAPTTTDASAAGSADVKAEGKEEAEGAQTATEDSSLAQRKPFSTSA